MTTPLSALKKLQPKDSIWLSMETENNLLIINGALALADKVSIDWVERLIAERFLKFERFAHKVVEVNDEYFLESVTPDIQKHITQLNVPSLTKSSLCEILSDLWAQDLPRDLPIWHFYLLNDGVSASVLVLRIHHCYADGEALKKLLAVFSDEGYPAQLWMPEKEQSISQPVRLTSKLKTLLKKPEIIRDTFKIMTMKKDDSHWINKTSSKGKKYYFSEKLNLADIKSICKAKQCTLNELLVFICTDCIFEKITQMHNISGDLNIRVAMPIDMHTTISNSVSMENKFGMGVLPIIYSSKKSSETAFKDFLMASQKLKKSKQPYAILLMYSIVFSLPKFIRKICLYQFTKRFGFLVSNLKGNEREINIQDVKVDNVFFSVPKSGKTAIAFSVFSYNESITLGLIVDDHIDVDPRLILETISEKILEMSRT